MWDGLSPGKLLCGRNGEWTTSWCCWNVSAETANGDLLCCLSWYICMKGKLHFPGKPVVLQAGRVQHPALTPVSKGFSCQLCSARSCLQTTGWIPAWETRHFPGDNKCDLWWNLEYSLKSSLFPKDSCSEVTGLYNIKEKYSAFNIWPHLAPSK